MSVSGQYCAKFADASHVCFEGHLRAMAIQCILSITDKTVTLSKSGTLKILPRGAGKQKVKASFTCPIFGKQTTEGFPFKDTETPAISTQH